MGLETPWKRSKRRLAPARVRDGREVRMGRLCNCGSEGAPGHQPLVTGICKKVSRFGVYEGRINPQGKKKLANRRSFKSDESFLEKISIGAVGTYKVFDDLKAQGHNPLELERGSMSFKVWKKIKIKRIRVPDLLCADCGRRIESRAKTVFEISMSHSSSDSERSWDYGLDDDDFVAFVAC